MYTKYLFDDYFIPVSIADSIDFDDPNLVDGLSSYHWLMGMNPSLPWNSIAEKGGLLLD